MVIELIQPPVYIPFFCTELHSNFNQLTPVYLIRYQIAFFINLLQSLFGSTIQFKFKYINILRSFHHCIRPSAGTTNLCSGKLPHQFEN